MGQSPDGHGLAFYVCTREGWQSEKDAREDRQTLLEQKPLWE